MKFSFRKIGSILASGAMLSSTVALAAAANFPAPFVSGGTASVAIVHGGADAAFTDLVAVTDIASKLSSELAKQTASGGGGSGGDTVTGEAYALFTDSKKIYLNDSINKARTSISEGNLPNVLKDGTLQGDVTATYSQKIDLLSTTGTNGKLVFGRHPTSDDDPTFAIDLGTTAGTAMYNLTVIFNKGVNFTHADTEGESLKLFGQDFTIGTATDNTNLILLKSSTKVSLTSNDPSTEVTIEGKTYTVELVSASDSGATIRVTDSTGASDSKEITEGQSRTIKGLEVGVDTADETNLQLSATLLIGSDRIKLSENAGVKKGSDETTIDGTNVRFGDPVGQQCLACGNLTRLTFQMGAGDADTDALLPGESFVDPVFGSLKMEFSDLNIPETSTDREDIAIKNSGSEKMTVNFKTWQGGDAKTINWYYNKSDSLRGYDNHLGQANLADSSGKGINVFERAQINKSEYVVVGNEENGCLWELKTVSNSSDDTKDTIEFQDVFAGDIAKVVVSSEGSGTIDMCQQSYSVFYSDDKNQENDEFVRLRYQDGSKTTANNMVVYPTIQTSKGARLFFYEPIEINATGWDGSSSHTANLSVLKFPDGDGFTSINVQVSNEGGGVNVSINNAANLTTSRGLNASNTFSIGQLTYNVSTILPNVRHGMFRLQLQDIGGTPISTPAIVIFEEQDDSTSQVYEAIIVKIEGAGTSAASVGVSDVEFTWGRDAEFDDVQVQSDTDLYKQADFWGTIVTTDQSDTDSYISTISYPDSQVYAKLYMGEVEAAITAAGGGGVSSVTELGSVAVADSEVGSVAGKNLIVVGGSCVNSVAASLLGVSSPTCGAAWTAATGVASGEFLIQTFSRTGDKVATLVAGTNAGDTTNAAKALTTQTIDTTVGKKYKGTSATAIEAVMEETG